MNPVNGLDPEIKFTSFEHNDLSSPTSIRLLSFIKRPRDISPPSIMGIPLIECILECMDLNSSPEYDVISSARGNPRQLNSTDTDSYGLMHQYPIAVNGRIMYIPRNIYEALQMAKQVNDPIDRRHEPFHKTVLIQAAEENQMQVLQDALQQGAYIHAQDCFGETAIHYAMENGHWDIVDVLLDHGASMDMVDSHGRTPRDCCSLSNRNQWDRVEELSYEWDQSPETRQLIPAPWGIKVGRPIWIEAISVGHSSSEGQVCRIPLVKEIYIRAQSIVAWLGVPDQDTEIARNAITATLENAHDWVSEDDSMSQDDDSSTVEDEAEEAPTSEIEDLAVINLLSRSWFERPDLLSEVAIGRAIIAYCGSHTFLLSEILEFLRRRNSREVETIPSDLGVLSLIGTGGAKKRRPHGPEGQAQKRTRRRREEE
ncbi:hypothetical protein F66182_3585 [Fusarium sp. NRRL 66182]|nr:hypothetical protein F66182_3585 [Fusarium sp. NRRL 66182]